MGCGASKQKLADAEAKAKVDAPELPELVWKMDPNWPDFLLKTARQSAKANLNRELKEVWRNYNFFNFIQTKLELEHPSCTVSGTIEDWHDVPPITESGEYINCSIKGFLVMDETFSGVAYQLTVVIVKKVQMLMVDPVNPNNQGMYLPAMLTLAERKAAQKHMIEMVELMKEKCHDATHLNLQLIAGDEMWTARYDENAPILVRPLRPGAPKALTRYNTTIRNRRERYIALTNTVILRAIYLATLRRYPNYTIWDLGPFSFSVDEKEYEYPMRLLCVRRGTKGLERPPHRIRYHAGGPASERDFLFRLINDDKDPGGMEELHLVVTTTKTWPVIGDYKGTPAFLAAEAALLEEAKRLNKLGRAQRLRLSVHMGVDVKRSLFIGGKYEVQPEVKRDWDFYGGFDEIFNLSTDFVDLENEENRKMFMAESNAAKAALSEEALMKLKDEALQEKGRSLRTGHLFLDTNFSGRTPSPLLILQARRWMDQNFPDFSIQQMDESLDIPLPHSTSKRSLEGVKLYVAHDESYHPRTIIAVVATAPLPKWRPITHGQLTPWRQTDPVDMLETAVRLKISEWAQRCIMSDAVVTTHVIMGPYARTGTFHRAKFTKTLQINPKHAEDSEDDLKGGYEGDDTSSDIFEEKRGYEEKVVEVGETTRVEFDEKAALREEVVKKEADKVEKRDSNQTDEKTAAVETAAKVEETGEKDIDEKAAKVEETGEKDIDEKAAAAEETAKVGETDKTEAVAVEDENNVNKD